MASPDASSMGAEPVVPTQSPRPNSPTAFVGAPIRIWLLVTSLAVLAAAAAWLAGERTSDYFKASRAASENYRDPTGLNREMPGVNARNGALTYGILGGLLGLALGAAGGLAGRSAGRALLGAVAGLILGTAAGALPPFVVMPWHWQHRNDDPATLDLFVPLLIHLALWSAAGLAAGLAFGIGSQGAKPTRLIEAALAGLMGAMLGILVFEMVGALLFPSDHTADPFPGTARMRLFARVCLAVFIGLGTLLSYSAISARKTGLEDPALAGYRP